MEISSYSSTSRLWAGALNTSAIVNDGLIKLDVDRDASVLSPFAARKTIYEQ